MIMERYLGRVTALAMLIGGLAACSGGGGNDTLTAATGSASMTVALMDAPVDDVIAVNLSITSIWLKPEQGPAFELEMENGPMAVNLLAHGPDNAALLVDGETIDAGK